MTEELKEQIELLREDLQFMEWLDQGWDAEGGEKALAMVYITQESPFTELEPEND